MREIVIAMADITQGDDYLMQLRSHDATKAAAGLIGFFGGKLDDGESPEQAVSREIGEETNIESTPEDFVHIGPFSTIMPHDNEEIIVSGNFFHYEVSPDTNVIAKEGELVRIHKDALQIRIHEMSPATTEAIKQYLTKENQ